MGTYKCENCGREATWLDGQKDIYCAMCGYGKLLPLITEKDGGSKVPCSDLVIKPCPFCGNEALWYENENLSEGWGNYACTVCGAKRFPNASNKREGLITWNVRAL